jgi:hypothetical protein
MQQVYVVYKSACLLAGSEGLHVLGMGMSLLATGLCAYGCRPAAVLATQVALAAAGLPGLHRESAEASGHCHFLHVIP